MEQLNTHPIPLGEKAKRIINLIEKKDDNK